MAGEGVICLYHVCIVCVCVYAVCVCVSMYVCDYLCVRMEVCACVRVCTYSLTYVSHEGPHTP